LARAHSGLDSLTKYLKTRFPWKEEWYCERLEATFTYEEVKEALKRLKKTDPKLHRLLEYRWLSHRSRSAIANSLYMDSSTLKRSWDKAMNTIVNWLNHGIREDLVEELDAIDLLQYD
jgi:hypothetical protein